MRAVALLVALGALSGFASEGGAVYHRRIVTGDGTALVLYRYRPDSGGGAERPVLLVPEVGFTREAFDLRDRGWAVAIARSGRDVFVIEPRGHGLSQAPPAWRLRDLVSEDLPTAVRAIRELRPEKVDLVAWGFGGALALAACARELEGQVGRVVALSTPVEPSIPNRHAQVVLASGGAFARLSQDGAAALEVLFAQGARLPPGQWPAARAGALANLSPEAARDLLSWMESGDLRLADGTTVLQRLALYDRPTLQFLGLKNNFAHPEFGSRLREVSKATVSVRVLSRVNGSVEDYSHLSLVQGVGLERDLVAPAVAFLSASGVEASSSPTGAQRR